MLYVNYILMKWKNNYQACKRTGKYNPRKGESQWFETFLEMAQVNYYIRTLKHLF